jgi:hypothetical protein
MKIEIFTLCDYATDRGNKSLCIVDTGEIFQSKRGGYFFKYKFLAYRIRFEANDKPKLRLTFQISDSQGNNITTISTDEFEVVTKNIYGFNAETGVVTLENFSLPKSGVYSASLFANGELLASIPIFVFQSTGTG